ncbi:DUF1631 family protein [Diaphorobacter sp.]|uniref:DUF1631 family protein n=1 Tax=Diaphorobacter sp. TaxID=1934310 RepID=UPI0028B078CA|nr:DUF1631 family protein [Diaphorobacter sp.]
MNIRDLNIPAVLESCLTRSVRDSASLASLCFRMASENLAVSSDDSHPEEVVRIKRAAQALDAHQEAMSIQFADALTAEFVAVLDEKRNEAEPRAMTGGGELSLVDENELITHVELSRVRQLVLNATESEVAQLNTYVCAAMGLPNVQPARNPFRQESYIKALQHVVNATTVELDERRLWMRPLGEAFGRELARFYGALLQQLVAAGVQPVGFALSSSRRSNGVAHKEASAEIPRTGVASEPSMDGNGLDRLADQLAHAQFGREEPEACTLPGAGGPTATGQTHVEVSVARIYRMLDSLEKHPRLHVSLRPLVRQFEQPLRQLVELDPDSFFTQRDHPARGLLDDMTRRSMQYPSEESPGFDRFLKLASGTVRYLLALPIHDATAFAHVRRMWDRAWSSSNPDTEFPMSGSTNASSQLVLKIAEEFSNLPAASTAPRQVVHFLTSIWAEVVAKTQLSKDKRHIGRYLTVAPALLWCAQPQQRPEDAQRLLAQMETLCASIQLGLSDLQYPQSEIERVIGSVAQLRTPLARAAGVPELHEQVSALDLDLTPVESDPKPDRSIVQEALAPASTLCLRELALGQWYELCTQGRSIHTRLTWIGPQRTSFIFTAVDGSTQALTMRMLEKLNQDGAVRRISGVETEATPLI